MQLNMQIYVKIWTGLKKMQKYHQTCTKYAEIRFKYSFRCSGKEKYVKIWTQYA